MEEKEEENVVTVSSSGERRSREGQTRAARRVSKMMTLLRRFVRGEREGTALLDGIREGVLRYDPKRTSEITSEQFRRVLNDVSSNGVDRGTTEELLDVLDWRGNGTIDYTEFQAALAMVNDVASQQRQEREDVSMDDAGTPPVILEGEEEEEDLDNTYAPSPPSSSRPRNPRRRLIMRTATSTRRSARSSPAATLASASKAASQARERMRRREDDNDEENTTNELSGAVARTVASAIVRAVSQVEEGKKTEKTTTTRRRRRRPDNNERRQRRRRRSSGHSRSPPPVPTSVLPYSSRKRHESSSSTTKDGEDEGRLHVENDLLRSVIEKLREDAVQRSHTFSNEFARLNGVIEDLRRQLDECQRRDDARSQEMDEMRRYVAGLTGQIRQVERAVSPRPRTTGPPPSSLQDEKRAERPSRRPGDMERPRSYTSQRRDVRSRPRRVATRKPKTTSKWANKLWTGRRERHGRRTRR